MLSAVLRLKEMTPTSRERVLHGYGLLDTAHWFICLAETLELTGFPAGGTTLRTLTEDMRAQAHYPSPNKQEAAQGEAKKEEWIAHIMRQCDELARPMTRIRAILPPWAYSFRGVSTAMTATPNHALQRTATHVTLAAPAGPAAAAIAPRSAVSELGVVRRLAMRILLIAVLVLVLAVAALFVWFRFFYVARPEMPPLSIAPDDPLMTDAMRKAADSIQRFRELQSRPNNGARVKVPFVTSSDTKEFLWAEVLSLNGDQMEVRYLTPPVTHTGRLERLHTHPVTDLVDWQVELPSGKYAGGFTMRVMFVRGREQWGQLPPELQAEETKYE